MKAFHILLFMLAVFALLGIVWYFYPADGIKVSDDLTLRFPSYEKAVSDSAGQGRSMDVDSIIEEAGRSFDLKPDSADIRRISSEITTNGNRIFLPGDDYTFFDKLFEEMENAGDRPVRIMHYGDSQIELDRISSTFRQKLQERFGGSGPNMVPLIQNVPTVSVSQRWSGNMTRYSLITDSTTSRASHHRYGMLCQFAKLNGTGSFSFKTSSNKFAKPLVKEISEIALYFGNNENRFTATLTADTLKSVTFTNDSTKKGLSVFRWSLPVNVSKGSIKMTGNAELYAVTLDGKGGVAVDNDGLRGCAGFIFSGIDSTLMRDSFEAAGTRMIILEFGGNAAGGIYSTKAVNNYTGKILRQLEYFKKVSPKSVLMFIGPSDMGGGGGASAFPRLEELNDSLKSVCLGNGVAYWDLYRMMGGKGSMSQWVNHNPPYAGPDYIHFTTKGADHVGDVLAKSFLFYYDFYRERKYGEVRDNSDEETGDPSR